MRRPRSVLLLSALLTLGLVAVSACGRNTPPTDQTAADPNQGLGVAPQTSVTASAPPGPGAPPANNPPSPHSTLASKVGYVWVDQPANTYTASTAYQYNSSGGAIDITHSATGVYQVRFVGLADPGGVAHAQAYGPTSNYCAIMSWSDAGSDQTVSVRCYDAAGSLADSRFTANFAVGSMGAARFSYLWADQPGSTAKYKPRAEYRYDAVSSSGITVQRTNAGRYEVFLPAAGPQLAGAWTFQVTAYGSPALCKLAGFSASNRKAQVACRNAAGSFQDTRFALTFASSGSLVGRTDRPYGAFSEANDGVENPSTGNYSIRVPGLGQDKGQAVAVARGTFSTYCHVAGWNAAGADLDVDIVCFNPGGAAASSSFELAVTL